MINTRGVVFSIIVINIIMYLATIALGDRMYYWFGLFYPASPLFKPVQIVSHMFMHGGIWHIAFNMFALFMFGTMLERVWGAQRFLIFYFVTGLGAALLNAAVQAFIVHNFTGTFAPSPYVVNKFHQVAAIYNVPTVGASGAIFGVLVAFGMLFPNTELMLLFLPIPIKAKYFVPIYFVIELYLGIANYGGDNIAHFAHVGGAVFGFLLVKFWNRHHDYLY